MESEPLLRNEVDDPELDDDDSVGGGTALEKEGDDWADDLEDAPPRDEDDDI